MALPANPRPPRLRRTAALAVAAVALAAGVAGCSKQLDATKLESTIADQLRIAFPQVTNDQVVCPEGRAPQTGDTFTCQATVAGATVTFTVVQDDDQGNVSFSQNQVAITPDALAGRLAPQISAEVGEEIQLDCGTAAVLVAAPGETVTCTATAASGTAGVEVTFDDTQGAVSWRLV